ncbi:MAG: bifunctional UDP-sugar hydrolase/5'-nucleotidase, partial [Bacteroidota bacterium]|nr:bifunctional UDP-sugar hydrolase/5'-nucleotidase [Bacteroidota bacterium]
MKKVLLFVLSLVISSQLVFSQKLVILHTNDIHSKLTGYGPENNYTPLSINDDNTLGGFARLATLFANEKKINADKLLILDAGDFLMGTIFHTLEPETGFQLNLMKNIGYDVVTLGNHEFDFGIEPLAKIINNAIKNGGTPEIMCSFLKLTDEVEHKNLQKLYNNETIKPYTIIKKNGLKIGLFSVLGYEAIESTVKANNLEFFDMIKTAKKYTKILREEEKVDIVICLSHSGFYPDENGVMYGEDLELAKKVSDIDIIISGHTHVEAVKHIQIGKTVIVQTGSYLKNLGRLEVDFVDGKVKVIDYKLIPIDDKILGDKIVHEEIEKFKTEINDKIFSNWGLTYSKYVAEIDFDMKTATHQNPKAGSVGNFVADAINYYTDKYSNGTDVVVMVEGVLRENILKGKITPADAFRVVSLGFGQNDIWGYPLVKIYISAHELKQLLELAIFSNSPGTDSYLYFSGVEVFYNPKKRFLNKIVKIELNGKEIDISKKNKTLYSLTTDTYIVSFI